MTGLCECGCGEPTPLATKTRTALGTTKGHPVRFLRGHWARTREGRQNMVNNRCDWAGRHHSSATRLHFSAIRRKDDPGYTAIHNRLRADHPKTGVCEECGAETKTEYAFRRHPEPHTVNRDDYRELCRPCHRVFDHDSYRRASQKERAAA